MSNKEDTGFNPSNPDVGGKQKDKDKKRKESFVAKTKEELVKLSEEERSRYRKDKENARQRGLRKLKKMNKSELPQSGESSRPADVEILSGAAGPGLVRVPPDTSKALSKPKSSSIAKFSASVTPGNAAKATGKKHKANQAGDSTDNQSKSSKAATKNEIDSRGESMKVSTGDSFQLGKQVARKRPCDDASTGNVKAKRSKKDKAGTENEGSADGTAAANKPRRKKSEGQVVSVVFVEKTKEEINMLSEEEKKLYKKDREKHLRRLREQPKKELKMAAGDVGGGKSSQEGYSKEADDREKEQEEIAVLLQSLQGWCGQKTWDEARTDLNRITELLGGEGKRLPSSRSKKEGTVEQWITTSLVGDTIKRGAPFDLVKKLIGILPSASILALHDADGNTSLHSACSRKSKKARYDLLKLITQTAESLGGSKKLTMIENKSGQGPLHLLVSEWDDLTSFQLLCSYDDSAAARKCSKGKTVLEYAVENKHQCVALAIAQDPSFNLDFLFPGTRTASLILHTAIKNKLDYKLISALIGKKRSLVDENDEFQQQPLHLAVQSDNVTVAKLLIDNEATISQPTAEGNGKKTPLHLAVEAGNFEMVKMLVDNGADLLALNSDGEKPEDLIPRIPAENRRKIGEALNSDQGTEIHRLIKSGVDTKEIKAKIDKKKSTSEFDVDEFNAEGDTLLYLAMKEGNLELVNLLLDDYQAKPEVTGATRPNGKRATASALHKYLTDEGASLDIVETLVEHGASITTFYKRFTVLHLAAKNSSADHDDDRNVLVYLCRKYNESGLEIDKEDQSPIRLTALLTAAKIGRVDNVIRLMNHGADITKKAKVGRSAMQLLLDESSDVSEMNVYKLIMAGWRKPEINDISKLSLTDDKEDKKDYWRGRKNLMWTDFITHAFGTNKTSVKDVAFKVLEKLLVQNPRLVDVWIKSKDEQGRSAIDMANSTVKSLVYEKINLQGRYELYEGPPIHKSKTSCVYYAHDHHLIKEYADAFKELMVDADATMDEQKFLQALWCFKDEFPKRFLDEEVTAHFNHLEVGQAAGVNLESFVNFCMGTYGKARKVALKLFSEEEHYERELHARETLNRIAGSQQTSSDMMNKFVVQQIPGNDGNFPLLENVRSVDPRLNGYKFCMAMPAADRTLDAIYRQERPDSETVRKFLRDIAKSLQALHHRGYIHGDIKMLNVVRVEATDTMKLIDLDASVPIGSIYGGKFSSGVLPPEMFYVTESNVRCEQYSNYWQAGRDKEQRLNLQNKLRPVSLDGGSRWLVVKAFNQNAKEAAPPYELVTASPKLDIWAFGILIYHMITGNPLLKVNRDDDLQDEDFSAMSKLVEASYISDDDGSDKDDIAVSARPKSSEKVVNPLKEWVVSKLKCIEDSDVKSLLRSIFQCQERRVDSMDKILECSYFSERSSSLDELSKGYIAEVKEQTAKIENYHDKNLEDIAEHRSELLRAISEESDLVVPSSFVILDKRLDRSGKVKVAGPADNNLRTRWLGTLTSFLWSNGNDLPPQTKQVSSELYFYLVDEITGRPVVPADENSTYPIVIKKDPESVLKKLAPILKVSLAALYFASKLKVVDGFLGGYIVEAGQVVTEMTSAMSKLLEENTKTKTTRDSISCGINLSKLSPGETRKVSGAALAELIEFYTENDPNRNFAGLQRFFIEENGSCCWALPESLKDQHDKNQGGNSDHSSSSSSSHAKDDPAQYVKRLEKLREEKRRDLESIDNELKKLKKPDNRNSAFSVRWMFSKADR